MRGNVNVFSHVDGNGISLSLLFVYITNLTGVDYVTAGGGSGGRGRMGLLG